MDKALLFSKATATYGVKAQIFVLAEECAELSAAANRFANRGGLASALVEEIADVQIMIDQFFHNHPEYLLFLADRTELKLARLADRLNSSEAPELGLGG